MAKTIEFRVTRETSSRIFHLGNASPLVFQLEEFLIGDDGKLTARVSKKIFFFVLYRDIYRVPQNGGTKLKKAPRSHLF